MTAERCAAAAKGWGQLAPGVVLAAIAVPSVIGPIVVFAPPAEAVSFAECGVAQRLAHVLGPAGAGSLPGRVTAQHVVCERIWLGRHLTLRSCCRHHCRLREPQETVSAPLLMKIQSPRCLIC